MKTAAAEFLPLWLLVALVVLLSACTRTMMPTPNLYANTSTPLFGPLASELEGDVLQVLYATDRRPEQQAFGETLVYGNERSESAAFGIANVRIAWRDFDGDLDTDSRDWTPPPSPPKIEMVSVNELVRFPPTPYPFRVEQQGRIVIEPEVSAELARTAAQARKEIVRRLALTPRKEVYVHLHGVSNSFEKAVLSVAEFWHFLGREGVPIAYTWPAGRRGPFFYSADRESGEFTVLHLKQFLRLLASIPEIEKIHISAHSRGTDVVMTALRELIIESRAAGMNPRERLKIDNVILLAADMDLEVAKQRLAGEAVGPAFGRLTLYTNANDEALAAAKSLFRSRQRVGALEPTQLTKRQRELIRRASYLDVIVYEGSGGGVFRHNYFSDPAVSSDVVMILRYGWKPGEGKRRALEPIDQNIWRVNDAYLE